MTSAMDERLCIGRVALHSKHILLNVNSTNSHENGQALIELISDSVRFRFFYNLTLQCKVTRQAAALQL
jgi:hypothetical protein